jgi:hypothetical protein
MMVLMENRSDLGKNLRTTGRIVLASMLVMMPFAHLFPGTSPPSEAASYLHMASMAVFAFFACAAFKSVRARIGGVAAVFAFGVLMELLQHFLPYRHGSLADIYINGIGCIAGALAFAVMLTIWNQT